MERAARLLVGLVGAVVCAYGGSLLLAQDPDNVAAALTWLVAGVIIHDGLIVPATLGIAGVLVLARGPIPGSLVVGFVVLATTTVVAVPVLGRFGARPDNPTLLDRNYTTGWLVFAGLTLTVTALAGVREHRARTARGDERGARTRRR